MSMAKQTADFILERLGEDGVCLATSGPGAIHLLNGLYDAKLDHQPVLAIVGQQARMGLGGNYQQKVGRGHMASLSGTLATMGPGVPYAIAAKFCHPHRPAVALVGDGAMQMNGMAELITAKKYYNQWADPRLVVLVLNNRDLNQVTWEQRALQGDPMNPMTQRIPDVRYADFAELIGLAGLRVEQPEDIGDAWRQAFEADRPFVIDAVCDPNVPPLPPHIRVDQARSLVAALRKGDPEARGVVTQAFKEKVLEFLPGR